MFTARFRAKQLWLISDDTEKNGGVTKRVAAFREGERGHHPPRPGGANGCFRLFLLDHRIGLRLITSEPLARFHLITLDYVLRKGTQSDWWEKHARICVLCDAFCSHTALPRGPGVAHGGMAACCLLPLLHEVIQMTPFSETLLARLVQTAVRSTVLPAEVGVDAALALVL